MADTRTIVVRGGGGGSSAGILLLLLAIVGLVMLFSGTLDTLIERIGGGGGGAEGLSAPAAATSDEPATRVPVKAPVSSGIPQHSREAA